MNKPISITYKEFKTDLLNLINNSKLPVFILEDILSSVYTEIKVLATQQYESDLETYQKSESKEKKK